MADVTNELIFELLKRVQQDISDIKRTHQEFVGEFVTLRRHILALQSDTADVKERLYSLGSRIERIEHRLDLHDHVT